MTISLVPQYDANGLDTGLWMLNAENEIYANLALGMRGNETLIVGQYPDWDNESYDDDGYVDAQLVELGELNCNNPYEDEISTAILYGFLQASDAVAEV